MPTPAARMRPAAISPSWCTAPGGIPERNDDDSGRDGDLHRSPYHAAPLPRPGVLDGNGAITPAGDIADVGLRQAARLRDGHLRHSCQGHGLRHAVGTRFRAKEHELLLGEYLEWNYTCETFATFSTA